MEDEVGGRLRALRDARRLPLRAVAACAGISVGFLSQVERGIAHPSVATLRRISAALAVSMADLFADDFSAVPCVLHPADRPVGDFGVRGRKYRLTPSPCRHVEVFLGVFEPGGSTGEEPAGHGDSEEFVLVMEGRVELSLDGARHPMGIGDCIDYPSATPHRLAEAAGAPARVLWVVSPPA